MQGTATALPGQITGAFFSASRLYAGALVELSENSGRESGQTTAAFTILTMRPPLGLGNLAGETGDH